jgi:hypothetical protein
MSTVNEFAVNLPINNVGVVDITASCTLPPEVNASACDHIGVYMDSAQVMNYDPRSPAVLVDMVLSVSVADPNTGSLKTYKMVKRISMDKCKLACDAERLTPVQVVEAEDDPLEIAQIMEQFYAAKRAREIAGLVESAGTKAFNVLFRFDDEKANKEHPDAKHTATCTVKIDQVKDKAHAHHVWRVKYGNNDKKYPNAKITRATEIK